jgi:hypothetical protein
MVAGSLLAAGGLFWLSRISVTSSYVDGLLGPMLVFALGLGFLFVPLTILAVSGVSRGESGAASSLLNTMQQVGSSLGLSILVTVFGTASRNEATTLIGRFLATASPSQRAQFQRTGALPPQVNGQILAHGISVALEFAVLFALLSLAVSILVIRGRDAGPQGDAGAQVPTETAA